MAWDAISSMSEAAPGLGCQSTWLGMPQEAEDDSVCLSKTNQREESTPSWKKGDGIFNSAVDLRDLQPLSDFFDFKLLPAERKDCDFCLRQKSKK